MSQPSRPPGPPGVFTRGSILRHVLVMTATGSIGLMAVFFVDLLSLIYVSRLGNHNATAGVGYATQVGFFLVSVNIGLIIAVGALVSRAAGAGDRAAAKRLATNCLMHIFWLTSLTAAIVFPLRRPILSLLGARGEALDVASDFLAITLPSTPALGVGMGLSAILRAVGDARRAMYVTLSGAILTAFADPALIFGMGLGVKGAAISTVMSRCMFVIVGLHGVMRVHGMLARPERRATLRDFWPMMAIAIPAIVTNLAPPVANSYSLRVFSEFGESIVAAYSIIDRIVPVAFGVLFAMSGAVGAIIGQNFGAGAIDRVRSTLVSCFLVASVYAGSVWFQMWLGAPLIATLFGATGDTARLVVFFCTWGGAAWMALGCLFVANSAFNNLGYPVLSTLFNWGRATLGTIPFVTLGAHYWGAEGGQAGIFLGAALFGLGSIVTAFWVVGRLANRPRMS